jgi:hypothetical protein
VGVVTSSVPPVEKLNTRYGLPVAAVIRRERSSALMPKSEMELPMTRVSTGPFDANRSSL